MKHYIIIPEFIPKAKRSGVQIIRNASIHPKLFFTTGTKGSINSKLMRLGLKIIGSIKINNASYKFIGPNINVPRKSIKRGEYYINHMFCIQCKFTFNVFHGVCPICQRHGNKALKSALKIQTAINREQRRVIRIIHQLTD